MAPLVASLWEQGAIEVAKVFTIPLSLRQQQYEPIEEEPYFGLKPATGTVLNDATGIIQALDTVRARVGERSEEVPNVRDLSAANLPEELLQEVQVLGPGGCVLTIEMGDVEHVLAAGYDARGLISKLYVN